jgi:outer membrane biosynthesis protein TonB
MSAITGTGGGPFESIELDVIFFLPEQSEQREQPEQPEQPEQRKQSEQSEQREQREQPEQSEQSEQSEQPEQREQSEQLMQLSQFLRLSSAFCAASREAKYSTEHLLPRWSLSHVVICVSPVSADLMGGYSR